MSAEVAAAAIAAGASLLGSGANWLSSGEANSTGVALSRENRDFMFHQWLRENAYNDPSAVMARLQRAGLNPSLMYGEGTGGLPASASMNNVDAPRVNAPQFDPLVLAQALNLAANTEKTKADIDKVESDIDVNKGIIKVNDSTVLYNSALTSFTKTQQDKVIAEMDLISANVDEVNSRSLLNLASIDRLDSQTSMEWYRLFMDEKRIDAEIDKLASEKDWIDEQKKYYKEYIFSVISMNKNKASLDASSKDLTDAQKKNVEESTNGLKYSNGRLKIQLDLDKAGFAKTERELLQLKTASEVFQAAAASMDEASGVRNVPQDVKSAATNAANRAANRTNTHRQK